MTQRKTETSTSGTSDLKRAVLALIVPIMLCMVCAVVSCQKAEIGTGNDGEKEQTEEAEDTTGTGTGGKTANLDIHSDSLVLTTSSASYYLTQYHWTSLTVGNLDYALELADNIIESLGSNYRIPTRADATLLRTIQCSSSERILCTDDRETWYTFAMPSASVTKAGAVTTYTLLLIRVDPVPRIVVSVDTEWDE